MRFAEKKYKEEVRGILGKYLDGTEKEFREATDRILSILKVQHAEKIRMKAERDNAFMAADKTEIRDFF
jgi:hypothetical protein